MEREEAMKILHAIYNNALFSVRNALETLVPELRESEDERIRKTLVKYFKRFNQEDMWNYEVSLKDIVAYLEKHEELPFVKDVIPGLPGLYFYDGERMHFQGSPATEENPYDFAMSLQKQKEQKPTEYLDKDMVYAIMNKLHDLAFSQLIPINSDEYEKIDEITGDVRRLLDYPIEQKHKQEWSEDDELGFADAIRYIQDYGETSSDKYTQLRTKEIVDWLKSLRPQPKRDCKDCAMFLNGECTKPRWRPSEEQMDRLFSIIAALRKDYCDDMADFLASIYKQLKAL